MESGQLVPGHPEVTLADWQTDPQLRWTFQHVSEIFPVALVDRSPVPAPLPPAVHPATDLGAVAVTQPLTGVPSSVAEVMATSETDGWAVLHGGSLVAEEYARGLRPPTPHLLMSVSKSLVGSVAGILRASGDLVVERPVTDYLPDLAASGYAGATVRDLLDMRSGVAFSENYTDPRAEVRLLEQAIGWAPRTHGDVADSMRAFLRSLRQSRTHGTTYEYRSCETDVLGLVCEAAAGSAMAGLLSEVLWHPMGAEFDANIAVDREGTGMFDGGVSAALRDLLRFGALWLTDGAATDGRQVLPPAWVADTLTGGPDSAAVFATSTDGPWMPGGMYRNQMWFPSARRDVVLCLGIHGQMIYVNRATRTVGAKVSGWPDPQDPHKLFGTLAAFDAVAAALVQ